MKTTVEHTVTINEPLGTSLLYAIGIAFITIGVVSVGLIFEIVTLPFKKRIYKNLIRK